MENKQETETIQGEITKTGQKPVNGKTLTKYTIKGDMYSTFKKDQGDFQMGDFVKIDFKRNDNFFNIVNINKVEPRAPSEANKDVVPTPKANKDATPTPSVKRPNGFGKDINIQNAVKSLGRVYQGSNLPPKDFAKIVKDFYEELYGEKI